MEPIAELVRSALADGPRHRDDLLALVRPHDPSGGTMVWNGLGAWIELVRVPPSGTWEQRRADLYATAESWLGHSAATEEDGPRASAPRLPGGFRPARLAAAAGWAGVSPATLEPVAECTSVGSPRS
jgi:Winged helix DNA-binding domain